MKNDNFSLKNQPNMREIARKSGQFLVVLWAISLTFGLIFRVFQGF